MARMFMRGLRPQIRRRLESQSFSTLREVADEALDQEIEMSVIKDKGKGKRSFGAFEQQAPQQRGPVAPRFLGSCYNCGRKGYKLFMCRLPLAGPNSPGSYFRPPQQAQAQGHYSDFIPGRRGPDRQGQQQQGQQQQGSFQPQPSFQGTRWVLHVEEPLSP